MDDIILKIFRENNHELKHSDGFLLFSLKEKSNYWIVVNRKDLTLLLEEQISLFSKAKEIISDPKFDKNANLLVLHKVDNIESVSKDTLLKIEEDLYHFKKSIIYYTESESNNLKNKIDADNIVETFENLILDETIFEKHKMRFDNNDYESLLYRFAHKIPFIKIKINGANNIDSLEETNKRIVGENILNDLLESNFFTMSEIDFQALSNEAILTNLKIVLTDENQ